MVFFDNGANQSLTELAKVQRNTNSGIVKKMIVATGNVAMDLDLNRLNGKGSGGSALTSLRFDVEQDSFFTILVLNDELRGPIPSSMPIIPKGSAALPSRLGASLGQLVIENLPSGEAHELAVRDAKTGFTFFYIEGHLYDFSPIDQVLNIRMGRLLMTKEFASELGRDADAGSTVGEISISATMRTIEVTQITDDGQVESETLPGDPLNGTVPGPDVVVGDIIGLQQFGSSGSRVGLAVGTTSCNYGVVDLNWNALPSNDHPAIPQNLYRMSGGASNNDRFEQIGQSSVKHAFTALTQNICSLGCNGVGGSRLGSGCSDPYTASLNAGPNLGSKAWINPFTGAFPRGDSGATNPNNHSGHVHDGTSHRVLTEMADLNTTLNTGATYFAEGQYVTPHEYAWCQTHPGECNMNNNVSYRQYSVSGTTSFSFSPVGNTVRTKPAINAWTGATQVAIEPAPGVDGIGSVAYKVTNPSPGVWHYEYAVYNQNLDRAIQSFSVPLGADAVLSNIGFYMPLQHPGSTFDGSTGDAGFSSTPWAQNLTAVSMTWSSETLAQNPNANAIRWATMYNFRFDSNKAPQTVNATVGFFKTGQPITVQVQAPSGPTAAVSVSGRVTSSTGQSVYMARVSMTDGNGVTRTALTNPFGYYRFLNVTAGASYTMGARSKEYSFTSRAVQVNDNVTNADFVAQ